MLTEKRKLNVNKRKRRAVEIGGNRTMGLHICLESSVGGHPDWDYLRQGHDNEFVELLNGLAPKGHPEAKGFEMGYEITSYEHHKRPESIAALRSLILKMCWYDVDRYIQLCDLLEADENCWIYISY